MCEVAGLRIGFYSHQISERVQTVAYETAKKVVHLADRLFELLLFYVYDPLYKLVMYINPASLLARWNFKFIPACVETLVGDICYEGSTSYGGGILKPDERGHGAMAKEVVDNLKQHVSRPGIFEYEVRVLNEDSIYAACLPGGNIVMYKKLMDNLRTQEIIPLQSRMDPSISYADLTAESKVAAVMAHEIVHSDKRHAARSGEFILLVLAAYFLAKCIFERSYAKKTEDEETQSSLFTYSAWVIIGLVGDWYHKIMSKRNEYEADRLGMHLMQKAGYNLKAALWLQEYFNTVFPPSRLKWVRYIKDRFIHLSHPSSQERFEANKKTLRELTPG